MYLYARRQYLLIVLGLPVTLWVFGCIDAIVLVANTDVDSGADSDSSSYFETDTDTDPDTGTVACPFECMAEGICIMYFYGTIYDIGYCPELGDICCQLQGDAGLDSSPGSQ